MYKFKFENGNDSPKGGGGGTMGQKSSNLNLWRENGISETIKTTYLVSLAKL